MAKKHNDCPNCNKAFTPVEINFQSCLECKWPEQGLGQLDSTVSAFVEPPDPYDHGPALYGNDSWMH